MLTLRSNSYEGRYLELTVEETGYDPARNVHTLFWQLKSTGGISSRYYVADTTVTIAGTPVYFYDAPYWSENTTFPFPITTGSVSGTVEVAHSDAVAVTLSTRVYVSMTPEVYAGSLGLAAAAPDPGLGQAAQITAAEDGLLGQYITLKWTPRSASHVFTVSYELSRQGSSVTVKQTLYRPSTTSAYQGRLYLDYGLARTIPNSTRRTLELTLTTYASDSLLDSDQVGQPSAVTITVTVPEDAATRPVITAGSCSPAPALLEGFFLQGKTGVQAGPVQAEGKYGASIVRTCLRCEGREFDGPSQPLSQWGQVTVHLYALDSRGFRSQPFPVTVEVLPYFSPKLRPVEGRSRVTAQRCDEAGTPDDQGTWMILSARRSYSPVVLEGVQRNFCAVCFRYRQPEGNWSPWQQILAPEDTGDEVTTPPLVGILEAGITYEVELRAADTLGSETTTLLTLVCDRIFWHRDGLRGSLGFGERVQEEDVFLIGTGKTLKVRGALVLRGEAAQTLLDLAHPVGSVLETVSPDSPADTLGGTWVALSPSADAARWRRTG